MCVVSNIGDNYQRNDGWPWRPVNPWPPLPEIDKAIPQDFRPIWEDAVKDKKIADLEDRIKALEELIRKGKEFDAATGQPDCELDEKYELLRKIAKEMGVEITIP